MRRFLAILTTLALLAMPRAARAEGDPSAPSTPPPPLVAVAVAGPDAPVRPAETTAPKTPGVARASWTKDGSWGWFVTASSLFVGTTLTAVGLALDCNEGSNPCTRGASVAIWGGIGIAAIGSMIGLAVVRNGSEKARAPAAAFRARPPSRCTAH